MNDTPFLILLGGHLTLTDRLLRQVAGLPAIAADGGIRHAGVLELLPELWVGDFDSSPAGLQSTWEHIPREAHPPAKDMTDGALAVEAALERGATRLVIAGALGGERSDHAMQNLLLGMAVRERGISVLMTSGLEEAWPLTPGSQSFDLPANSLFSVLALSDLTGLTLEGVHWPLSRRDVPLGDTLTLSNKILAETEAPLSVGLEAGKALLIARPYDTDAAGTV
ncbi:thiamine diphosphokinase [Stappia taiwanensis]|uniref:Thiamine diphosphokinase n=1 Tax=Stappia taiwanensis TaxID=992267 RepID=A0A838XVS6_9HYPH|nr:thiamine diphosphokinase [Stappia taiwanensis]MBA4612718.1 thiamine diphosphokinase [Stappia taiwanensis]GGE90594.1 thiamine pyrophosphokinase [Stappia taiwanensis]